MAIWIVLYEYIHSYTQCETVQLWEAKIGAHVEGHFNFISSCVIFSGNTCHQITVLNQYA